MERGRNFVDGCDLMMLWAWVGGNRLDLVFMRIDLRVL